MVFVRRVLGTLTVIGFGAGLRCDVDGFDIDTSFQIKLLASAKGQDDARPQHEFAGATLQRSEKGWNEFAARARRSCQAHVCQQLKRDL